MDIFNLGYDDTRYPDGVQDFATLRNHNMVYVDKTAYVYKLTRKPVSYFLSRPRRFGKSLLLSTIEAYFQGRRELFDGLAIAKLEQNWTVHPVIRIDLSRGIYSTIKDAEQRLLSQMRSNALALNVDLTETTPDGQFYELIEKAYLKYGQSVVVLIDEYDKPILETRYDADEAHKGVHDLMRGFYGCIKSAAPYLRFVMITGITKVSHVNVFSGLNNLTDISLQPWCNAICGISESEMQQCFAEDMITFARINKIFPDEARAQFKRYYDGYRFAEYGENIYNPYSVMLAFQNMKFSNYWFTSGNPKHLIQEISRSKLNFDSLEGRIVSEHKLMGLVTPDSNPIGLLYQAGYLTIKGYEAGMYTVGFPNKEVESGFFDTLLMVQYSKNSVNDFSGDNIREAAYRGDAKRIVQLLDQGLIDYNYDQHKDIDGEAVLNSLLYGLVHAFGLDVQAEYHISNGRIDMLIENNRYIYLFEFKVNKSAAVAMKQINEKEYANKFKYDGRKLFKIGINYNTEKRCIDDDLIQEEATGNC